MKVSSLRRLNPRIIALFEATLAGVWGLALAVYVVFEAVTQGYVVTDSFLQSLLFGLGTSPIILLVVPALYFAIGWGLGYAHGVVFKALAPALGGAESPLEDAAPADNEAELLDDGPAWSRRAAPTFGERIPAPKERRRPR